MAPAIHVGPEPPLEYLVEAVKEGGGEIASLADAEAVVWAGSPEELPALPNGIKWVQLQSAGIEPWVERIRDTPEVQWTSAVGAYATQVAELALGAAARRDAGHPSVRARHDLGAGGRAGARGLEGRDHRRGRDREGADPPARAA